MASAQLHSTVPLDAILATEELSRRATRPPNDAAVNAALVVLAQTMANSPNTILQRLVETALALCQAHSSGISLLEEESGKQIFRWHGVAGEYAPHLWGTTPREFSPCGTVLDTDAVQLMSRLDRHFGYFAEVTPRIEEALLVPFHLDGKAVGTIWVISHEETRQFDAEDARVMSTLGEFAAAAYQVVRSVKALKESKAEVERSLEALTESKAEGDTANQNLRYSNKQLRKAEAELQVVNTNLRRFAFAASHDLQEPLRTITAFTQLLHQQLSEKLDENTEQIFTMIANGASRMKILIQDLLEYSHVLQTNPAPFYQVSLMEVLSETLADLQDLIDGAHATITFDALPPVFMDKGQVSRVLQNLVTNAIKYRREEEAPRIHVAAERGEGHWIISVTDNGEGFAPQYAESIFEVFKRLHGSEISGSGMGLALCQKIVKGHGGTIYATSIEGAGSVFSFTLPDEPAASG